MDPELLETRQEYTLIFHHFDAIPARLGVPPLVYGLACQPLDQGDTGDTGFQPIHKVIQADALGEFAGPPPGEGFELLFIVIRLLQEMRLRGC